MCKKISKAIISHFLSKADITVNGSNPWDIRVKNENVFKRILFHGTLGLGESYMDGWWECDAIDEFICKALENKLDKKGFGAKNDFFKYVNSKLFNLQKKSKAFNIG